MKTTKITWRDLLIWANAQDQSLTYYGIPRGGQYLAALLTPVDRPEDADVIVDDLIDSGATMEKWISRYPDKKFIAFIDKRTRPDLGWLEFPWEKKADEEIEDNIRRILERFDDINREGLRETPKRYIKFLREFLSPPDFNFTTFDSEGMDQMIIQKDIEFHSLCEHHLAPFFGRAHVAYIPDGKIVGLSKLARVVEKFSRGFQNQERITQQIAEYIDQELNPKGVAVILEAQHLCMSMRGVRKSTAKTTTSKMIGSFRDDLNCRNEFINIVNHD